MLVKHSSGIEVLLAPPPSYGALDISLPQVEQIVSNLRSMFDWVFIDLGVLPDEAGYAFLDNADYIVMTVLPELVCLRNTRLMLDQLHARGYGENKVRLVLNRAGISGGVSQGDIEERLHVRIHHTVPDDQPLVSLSINRGVPLILSHSRSAVARAIQSLAQRFVAETAGSAAVASNSISAKPNLRGGLFNRVFHRATSVDA